MNGQHTGGKDGKQGGLVAGAGVGTFAVVDLPSETAAIVLCAACTKNNKGVLRAIAWSMFNVYSVFE